MDVKIPENATIITPYITVRDAEKAIEFYRDAFGFKLVKDEFLRNAEGKAVHVAMTFEGKTVVMFGPEDVYPFMKSPATNGVEIPVVFYVYCADVDSFT